MFQDGSSEIVRRSWGGILILTGVSFYAAPLYFILAWKIVRKLANDNPGVSVITQKLNRHLFKALVVQVSQIGVFTWIAYISRRSSQFAYAFSPVWSPGTGLPLVSTSEIGVAIWVLLHFLPSLI